MQFYRNFLATMTKAMVGLSVLLLTPPLLAEDSSSSSSPPKIFGDILFTSNYMNEAISFSNNSLAVQPTLGYDWGHFQYGVTSSNVQFPDNGESLNIRPYLWYQLVINPILDFKIRADYSLFFSSGARNGTIVNLDMNLWTHHAIIEDYSNWYGTGLGAYWLAYAHNWALSWGPEYKLEVGYLMTSATTYTSYFGTHTGFGYKYGDFYWELLGSFNSNSSQFNGTANPTVWLQLSTKF